MHGKCTRSIGLANSRPRGAAKRRRCNLCGRRFYAESLFARFCASCKEREELLRFGDWLPEINEDLAAQLSA